MVLELKDLCVDFTGMRGKVRALNNVSLSIEKGEVLGVVGESGSGKSVTALSILGLLGSNANISNGEISYSGQNLLTLGPKKCRACGARKSAWCFRSQ